MMPRMCTGIPVDYEHTVRERVARPYVAALPSVCRHCGLGTTRGRLGRADIARNVILHMLDPHFLDETVSYDMASNYCQPLMCGELRTHESACPKVGVIESTHLTDVKSSITYRHLVGHTKSAFLSRRPPIMLGGHSVHALNLR